VLWILNGKLFKTSYKAVLFNLRENGEECLKLLGKEQLQARLILRMLADGGDQLFCLLSEGILAVEGHFQNSEYLVIFFLH